MSHLDHYQFSHRNTAQNTFKITVFFLLTCVLIACNEQERNLSYDGNTSQERFKMVYAQSFADRFNLASDKVIALKKPLKAVALELESHNGNQRCLTHFYVDASTPFYRPVVGEYFFNKPEAEYFFVQRYSDEDQLWNSSLMDRNRLRAMVRTQSLEDGNTGIVSSLEFERIHDSFLPNLSLLSFNIPCEMFDEPNHFMEVWIQKQLTGDYILGNDNPEQPTQPQNSLVFPIPIELVRSFRGLIQ